MVVTKRALVIFNFGVAIAFAVFGGIGLYLSKIPSTAVPMMFAASEDSIRASIQNAGDIGKLKVATIACYEQTGFLYELLERSVQDVRGLLLKGYGIFVFALVVGGLLALKLPSRTADEKP